MQDFVHQLQGDDLNMIAYLSSQGNLVAAGLYGELKH